ncbi:MAG: VOC family protein [Dehalococcoidales bacterium]|nr:VOC family protein [Dehalococcoidales bacterium]
MEATWSKIVDNNWELYHVGLIVKDLDKTIDYYQSLGLISGFQETPPLTPVRATMTVHTENGDVPYVSSKVKILRIGPLPIEMIQPGEGSNNANAEFLASKGDGVAHFGFIVDDLEAETAKLVEKGIKVVFSAKRQDGKVTMRYFDVREYGNILLELVERR